MRARGLGWSGVVVWVMASSATVASADIYVHRDADGVVHLTNVPATSMATRLLRESAAPRLEVPAAPVARRLPHGADAAAYGVLVEDACRRYGVEQALVNAIIRAESDFDPLAISRKGARGLMQLMPETARMHGVGNSFAPDENIEGGVRHLRMLLDQYDGNVVLAVAAYNAGAGRVDAAGGVPDIAETREYVRRVLRFRAAYLRGGHSVIAARR